MKNIFFLLAISFFITGLNAQTKTFQKIKYANLTKEGVKAYNQLAKMTPNIEVKNRKLYAIDDYVLWANENRIIVAPEETEDIDAALSTNWERRKYRWPTGGTLTTTCWCISEDQDAGPADDCEFDDSNGSEPIMIECVGTCGCNRTDTFGTTSPGGSPFVQSVTPF